MKGVIHVKPVNYFIFTSSTWTIVQQ